MATLVVSTSAYVQNEERGNIDTIVDTALTGRGIPVPVPYRHIHGTLGDADFTLELPWNWNGKLLIGSRGFSGDENGETNFRNTGLQKGYAYAQTDLGWFRKDIITSPQDQYWESRRSLVQLTHWVKPYVKQHYGRAPSRTLMVGGSNGGHDSKMMLEDYPNEFDGGLAGYGITSHLEWMGSIARFLRNYDVIAPRITAIRAARAADPNWNPSTTPLNPELTAEQLTALNNIYNMPARVGNITFNIGRFAGSESMWASSYASLQGYLRDSLAKMDRFYDPDGDGELTDDESKLWDPNLSKPAVANDLRRLDNNGRLTRPVLIMHGAADPIVSPGETMAYRALVEAALGVAASRNYLAIYFIPGMGHGGSQYNNVVSAQLDILEAWVDYLQSKGKVGSLPPSSLGG
ncbi:MAG: tannase/feruloyl esterase family alpha/beta hydrolase, partial [Vicinamibacterales bacterium]